MFKLRIKEDLGFEFWMPIAGYEGLYDVSTYGRVRGYMRGVKILKFDFKDGKENSYERVQLSKNGVGKKRMVHRLVYETFIASIPDDYEVHHINHIPSDNNISNLELLNKEEHRLLHQDSEFRKTFGERMRSVHKGKRGKFNHKSRCVIATDKNGNELEFESLCLAADYFGGTESTICTALHNPTTRTAFGHKWRFRD